MKSKNILKILCFEALAFDIIAELRKEQEYLIILFVYIFVNYFIFFVH